MFPPVEQAYSGTSHFALPEEQAIHVHFLDMNRGVPLVRPQELDFIQAAGFRKVRMDLLWSQVEKQPGVYDFRQYDQIIRGLLQRGLRPMVILGLGNPLYGKGLTIYPSSTRQAFERYALAAVSHFKNLGIIWELVNEPNKAEFWQPTPNADDYIALVSHLVPPLKLQDPGGIFVAPSTAGAPLDFLERCFRQGLLNTIDAVSIHPYQAFPNRNPEMFEAEVRQTKTLMKRYMPPGKEVPLLLGEWGYSTAVGEISEQTQANYMVRQALLGAMHGSPVNVWYDWKGTITGQLGPAEKENQFGLVNSRLQLKPAYFAMRELTRALQDQTFMRRLPSAPSDYLLLFSGPTRSTLAAWTTRTAHVVSAGNQSVFLSEKPCFSPMFSSLYSLNRN